LKPFTVKHWGCEMEWQPIETAPKDGRHIIAWFPHGFHGNNLSQFAKGHVEAVYWKGSDWYWSSDDDALIIAPTHWIPLPELPEVK